MSNDFKLSESSDLHEDEAPGVWQNISMDVLGTSTSAGSHPQPKKKLKVTHDTVS
jgi:hypothetical protein